ncbi:hypothetical protein SFC43_22565 [Bacteroides sp. CR5/BHMF/2]|nr:hypothetical protein [Bacteroides sp. CR5/BHMF/2]
MTTLNMDVDITQKLDMLTKGLSVSIKGSYDNQFQLNKNRTGGMSNHNSSITNRPWKTVTCPRLTRTLIKPLFM